MPTHLTERQVEEYRRRSLPPGELLEVDDHLAGCLDCRLRLAAGEPLSGAFAAWEGLPEEPRRSVGLDLGALVDDAGLRRARSWRRARPAVLALWAALLLCVAGLIVWLAILRREVGALRTEVRRIAEGRPERLPRPLEIADLLTNGAVLRGPASAPQLKPLSPLATAVRDGRPTFRWSPLSGAELYRVTVFDRDFNPLADSGPLPITEWRPARPLPAGAVYVWQVKARRRGQELTAPGPGSPQALFRVLAADRAAEIERATRQTGSSHLALGLLYARAGLLDDAERELSAAARESPGAEAPRELLATVRSWRPRPSPPQSASPTSTNAPQ
jgi:hypothetical protein